MAIEVFNRYENKYMLSEDTYNQIERRLSEFMEPDEFNRQQDTYTITNLYYDTEDNRLIRGSLMQPKYKEKLRLRAYGVPDRDAKVYIEIKKKVSGLVNKRRSELTLYEAYAFLQTGVPPKPQAYHNRQVLHEIEYILQKNELKPAVYLACDRRAYFGSDGLRISFDSGLRSRRYDLTLEAGDYGKPLLEEGNRLMEIKVTKSMPVWLCRLLSEYMIYPISFSKYGTEYKRSLGNRPQVVYGFTPEKHESHFTAAAAKA